MQLIGSAACRPADSDQLSPLILILCIDDDDDDDDEQPPAAADAGYK